MAKKSNVNINGKTYFKTSLVVGKRKDGTKIIKQFYGSSKKEAEEAKEKFRQSIKSGLSVDFDKIVFGDLFEEWFEHIKRPSITDSSYERYEATYRLHLKPSNFYSMKLIAIKSINIQKCINLLPSANTAERVYLLLSSFFKYCIEEQYLVRSPLISVNVPKHTKEKKKEFLERDEIKLVCDLPFEHFIFIFAAFTGMRQGEILALTHSDIDLENNTIEISKSVKRVTMIKDEDRRSQTLVKNTKTDSSNRTIPILSDLLPLIKKQITLEKEKHLSLGIKYNPQKALLFSTKNLTHKRGDHVLSDWKKVQGTLFKAPVTFHALRHTFCTMLCDRGVPIPVASELMGHKDMETTSKIYAHFMKESPKEAIQSLGNYYSS